MKNMMRTPENGYILALIVFILVIGSLFLAVIDENYRDTFADIAKVGLGGYIGLLMPRNNIGKR